MAKTYEQLIRVSISEADVSNSPVREAEFTVRSARARRVTADAIGLLLLFWVAAALSVFIPFVNFVLVPLFLLIGIYAAFRGTGGEFFVERGEIRCPRCAKLSSAATLAGEWPIAYQCPHCRSELLIRPVGEGGRRAA